ncbi:MAG: membrane protein insertase YidC [Solobacterium sp.]|nr:membrane protein insertase YidC [Solobacterium sp.]
MELLGKILGAVMTFCYSLSKNYGLAIILFTLFSKIVLLPVSIWVQKNSIKMVKMMPQINQIKINHFGDGDTISEEQQKLYKENHYNPLASLIPLAIQIFLLMGVVEVIYHPFEYILSIPNETISSFKEVTLQKEEGLSPESNSLELYTIERIQNGEGNDYLSCEGEKVEDSVKKIKDFEMSFLGMDLSWTASILGGITYIVPLLAGLSSFLLSFAQNRINVLQSAQSLWNKWGTAILSVGLSLYLGTFVPAGVALYWVASNLMAIIQLFILNKVINPKQYIDYEALNKTHNELSLLEAQTKKNKIKRNDPLFQRERNDYKRFLAIDNKHLVFYSESNGFYKYFKSFIEYILKYTNIPIHYITSDPKDNIFKLAETETKIQPYFISETKLIPLMMKMDADVVFMTMPDLENFHIKRSRVRKDVEYIYFPHGVGSNNLTMRKGSMDNYDTIFAICPHQREEVEKTEIAYGLKKKKIINVGYPLLEEMIDAYKHKDEDKKEKPLILIAPSWQKDNIVDLCLEDILDSLKDEDYRIVVRPHPQHVKHMPEKMELLKNKYASNPNIEIQTDFSNTNTVVEADVMISDWSGVATEYFLTTNKPVLYVDTPMKVMNPEYTKIDTIPFNIWVREKVGKVISLENIHQTKDYVRDLLEHKEDYKNAIEQIKNQYVYNLGNSTEVGAKYIIETIFNKVRERHSSEKE